MMNIPEQLQLTLAVILVSQRIPFASSHGRLWEPPSRSTMWRRGFKTPINYDDAQLFCGGFQHQLQLGYKCGLCGDAFDSERDHETGGKYATRTISREYTQGQQARFQIDLTAYHKGYFEFKICPRNDPKVQETQECLDEFPVSLADGSGTKYYPDKSRMISIDVMLPAGLTCEFCVLQWRYHAGNSYGQGPEGNCIGCGPQEEFYGCADIRIVPGNSSSSETRPETPDQETVPSQPPEIYTTTPHAPDQSDSKTDGNVCRGLHSQTHLDKWCQLNCQLGNCPETHCTCSEESKVPYCRGVNEYANNPTYEKWCNLNCAAGVCPPHMCVCDL